MMEDSDIFSAIVGLFSGGISGAVSNFVLLVALVIASFKVKSFMKKEALAASKEQARNDRSDAVTENQSKDQIQHEDEVSLDKWREETRNAKDD